jgi:hypothetical protein
LALEILNSACRVRLASTELLKRGWPAFSSPQDPAGRVQIASAVSDRRLVESRRRTYAANFLLFGYQAVV